MKKNYKIGLIDADMMWNRRTQRRWGNSKADVFPNLVLMKISAFWKRKGAQVEWYDGLTHYDRVYVSKVFNTTPDSTEPINADQVVYGGSGYSIKLVDGREVWTVPDMQNFGQSLPYIVEHIYPDYDLYPMVKDTAIGFLTRGCPRGCPFCHVAAKEGKRSYKVADLNEWWHGQKRIILCDPNLLACPDRVELLQQLIDSKAKIDINQGMDARMLTPEIVGMLNQMKLSTIHFAWDDYRQKDAVLKGLQCFKDHYKRKFEKGHMAQVFVLTNYDTTPEQDLERIYTLRDMGFDPYIMVYNKSHAAPFYKSLQRWVNNRAIFHKITRYEDYSSVLAKE